MLDLALQALVRSILAHIPWTHWLAMGLMALTVPLLLRKKCSTYGAIALGLTVFLGLFLLDAAVINRYLGTLPQSTGFEFTFRRLFHSTESGRAELFANLLAFVPFGYFLSEFLSTTRRLAPWRRLGLATLLAFALSLCIECLQLVLRVGFFELTDLVLNTVGGGVGAGTSVGWRKVVFWKGRGQSL